MDKKFTHEFHLSDKVTYAIIAAGVLGYLAFVLYLELNNLA